MLGCMSGRLVVGLEYRFGVVWERGVMEKEHFVIEVRVGEHGECTDNVKLLLERIHQRPRFRPPNTAQDDYESCVGPSALSTQVSPGCLGTSVTSIADAQDAGD